MWADTFDYFVPERWAFGKPPIDHYPGTYACEDLYPGWSATCCTGRRGRTPSANLTFDARWNVDNLDEFALAVRQRTPVPLFVNQWSVVHGVRAAQGRYQFMEDVAATLQKFDLGWSWWVWAGGGGATWAHGSSEFLYRFLNGTEMLDRGALEAVRNHMSDSDRYG